MWWKLCFSMVLITICGAPKMLGSSRVPTLRRTAPGMPEVRVRRWVPHSGQNSRVTGFSRSPRWKSLGEPLL
jgi:hypothetical protein